MKAARVAVLSVVCSMATHAQVVPQFNPDELLKCMSEQEIRKLAEDYVRGVMERSAPLIDERKQKLELALQKTEQAEEKYKHCMKVESADLSVQTAKRPLPCAAERASWFAARKEGDRLVSKAEREAFRKRLEPLEKLELERFELMVKLRCPK